MPERRSYRALSPEGAIGSAIMDYGRVLRHDPNANAEPYVQKVARDFPGAEAEAREMLRAVKEFKRA